MLNAYIETEKKAIETDKSTAVIWMKENQCIVYVLHECKYIHISHIHNETNQENRIDFSIGKCAYEHKERAFIERYVCRNCYVYVHSTKSQTI